MNNAVIWKSACEIAENDNAPWSVLEGKTVAITGATGLIGSSFIFALMVRNKHFDSRIRIVAFVRNVSLAQQMFDDHAVEICEWSAGQSELSYSGEIDFVVHCASPTNSTFFLNKPYETISTIVHGLESVLDFSLKQNCKCIFLSTMEVYGRRSGELLNEQCGGEMDAMDPRSSYPQAKQLAETMCAAFANEFDLDVCVARLAQSFGPGVHKNDTRVFAQIGSACKNGTEFHMLTAGTKKNMYVYTFDVVSALVHLFAYGQKGFAYNVANPMTYMTVRNMAELVFAHFASGELVMETDAPSEQTKLFRPEGQLNLDVSRLEALGWEPTCNLIEMYARMIDSWKYE